MATINIRKTDGSEAGKLDLSDSVFGVDAQLASIRAEITRLRAAQRAGTHATKTRGQVRGGGRKPYRQKGTGRARQGSIRATQWRGGAIAFGPTPRDHSISVNRKVRRQAYRSVWSELLREGRVIVVENFGVDKPRTRQIVEMLDKVGANGSVLLVSLKTDENMALSARNLPWAKACNSENLNLYDLINHDYVVATPEVIQYVEATYA